MAKILIKHDNGTGTRGGFTKEMKWQCPKHPQYLYFAPGKCLVCKAALVARAPLSLQIVRAIVSDPKTLRATVELGVDIIRKIL